MKFIKLFAIGVACLIIWYSCVSHDLNDSIGPTNDLQINLRWLKSYPTQTQEDVIIGLKWNFSFLGAELSKGSIKKAMVWQDSLLVVDLSLLGFNDRAELALGKLLAHLKKSKEYEIFASIDIGRFVMLTLNSTNHYYEITGAKPRYTEYRNQFQFIKKQAAVIISGVAFNNRLIEISSSTEVSQISFVALEGEGSVADSTFEFMEYETIDIMRNGQLRFAVYDAEGNLKNSATPSLTRAGKPAKCLWCHETTLGNPLFDDHQLPNFYSTDEFSYMVFTRMEAIREFRKNLNSDLDFSLRQEHTKGELLYLSFMEPSVERLAREWDISIVDAAQKVADFETHPHDEFSFLGSFLYNRREVDLLSPFETIQVPEDPREYSEFEPDFIH